MDTNANIEKIAMAEGVHAAGVMHDGGKWALAVDVTSPINEDDAKILHRCMHLTAQLLSVSEGDNKVKVTLDNRWSILAMRRPCDEIVVASHDLSHPVRKSLVRTIRRCARDAKPDTNIATTTIVTTEHAGAAA